MRNHIAALLGAVSLTACVSASEGGYANDDPGPYPSNYEQLVKSHLRQTLKDPYSVMDLNIAPPVRTSAWIGIQRGGNAQAWVTFVSFNAKNSFGAYVGTKCYRYYIKGGAFMRMPTGGAMIFEGCNRADRWPSVSQL